MNIPVIPCDDRVIDIPLDEVNFCLHLAQMETGHSENMRRAAANIREMLSEGIVEFCSNDWIDRVHTCYRNFNITIWSLRKSNMIEVIYGEKLRYRFKTEFLMPPMTMPEIRECPYPTMDSNTFWMRLAQLRRSFSRQIRQVPMIVKSMIKEGKMEFTAKEWLSRTGMSKDDYSSCRGSLLGQQLIVNLSNYDNSISVRIPTYRFTLRGTPFSPDTLNQDERVNPDFWNIVYGMCNSPTRVKQQASEIIRMLLERGRIEFTVSELETLTQYSHRELNAVLVRLKECGLIVRKSNERRKRRPEKLCIRYRMTAPRNTLTMSKVNGITQRLTSDISIPDCYILTPDEFWSRVEQMASSNANAVRFSARIVKSMIADGITSYTRQSWLAYSGMEEDAYAVCRTTLKNKGLVYNLTADSRNYKRATGRYAFTLEGLDRTTSVEMFMKTNSKILNDGLRMNSNYNPELFRPILEEISQLSAFDNFVEKVISFMKKCSSHFSELQWAEMAEINSKQAAYECSVLLQMGLVQRFERGNKRTYAFRFETTEDLEMLIRNNEIHKPRGEGEFWNQLATLEWSRSDSIRKAPVIIRNMISEGIQSFTWNEWVDRNGTTIPKLKSMLKSLLAKGIIRIDDGNPRRYWITNTSIDT